MFNKLKAKPDSLSADMFDNKDDFDGDLMRTLVEIMFGSVTDDEIKMWRRSPASIYAHMQDTAVQAGVATVAQVYAGNPNVDQQAVLKRNIEGMVGPELAAQFVVPGIDQTVAIEAQRQQEEENFTMYGSGKPIKVSPRDNHLIHAATAQAALEVEGKAVLEAWGSTPPNQQKAVELVLNHMGDHLEAATQLGQNKVPAFKALEDFYKGFKKDLEAVVQVTTEAQANAALVMQKIRTEGVPTGDPAAAVSAPAATAGDSALGIPPPVGLEAQAFNAAEKAA